MELSEIFFSECNSQVPAVYAHRVDTSRNQQVHARPCIKCYFTVCQQSETIFHFYSTVLFSTFSDIKMQNEINSTKYRGLLILKWKNRGYTELSIAMTASYSRITTSRYWRILGRTWLLNMQLATILRINQSTLFVNIVTSTIELSTMTRERSTEFQAVFYSRPIDKQIDQTQLSYIFFKLFWCCNKFANLVQS